MRHPPDVGFIISVVATVYKFGKELIAFGALQHYPAVQEIGTNDRVPTLDEFGAHGIRRRGDQFVEDKDGIVWRFIEKAGVEGGAVGIEEEAAGPFLREHDERVHWVMSPSVRPIVVEDCEGVLAET